MRTLIAATAALTLTGAALAGSASAPTLGSGGSFGTLQIRATAQSSTQATATLYRDSTATIGTNYPPLARATATFTGTRVLAANCVPARLTYRWWLVIDGVPGPSSYLKCR